MPTKNDFIIQIEADIENETELVDVLQERLAAVQAAGDDDAAKQAYFDHLAQK
jgi:hypothetical protein